MLLVHDLQMLATMLKECRSAGQGRALIVVSMTLAEHICRKAYLVFKTNSAEHI